MSHRNRTAGPQGPIDAVLDKYWNRVHDLEADLMDALREYDIAASYSGGPGERDAQEILSFGKDVVRALLKISDGGGAFDKLYKLESRFLRSHGSPRDYQRAQQDAMGLRAASEYGYDRRKVASLEPTVENFLLILRGNLIQSDEAQQKRDRSRGMLGNPYALGLQMEALDKIRQQVSSILRSSDPDDLETMRNSILRHFHDVSPVRKTIKALDTYLKSGKAPKYPTGGGKPIWR